MSDDFNLPNPPDNPLPEGPVCARCMNFIEVFPANCAEKPEKLLGAPIGMYHCPDCGAMVLAGMPHPKLCAECNAPEPKEKSE